MSKLSLSKLSLSLFLALPLAWAAPAAAATPGWGPLPALGSVAVPPNVIAVKNGKGHVRKIGRREARRSHVNRSNVGRPYGWNQGRKTGWRGYGCPPGLAKQGRC